MPLNSERLEYTKDYLEKYNAFLCTNNWPNIMLEKIKVKFVLKFQ